MSCLYLPQTLDQREIHFSTARPLVESFALRCGIYDAPYCANVDGKSSTKYLKDFFNVRYFFADEQIKTRQTMNLTPRNEIPKKALILFSFGKESLLAYALCKELGIETVLVTIIHPGFEHEWAQKKPLVEQFEKEFGETVHTIDYKPGLLKEGHIFNTPTELGWGLHVTEYAILALPFAEVFDTDVIICGNEQSCNDTYFDKEDVLIYRAGLDQHREWTSQQGLLQSLLIGRSLPAISLVEPLYEIAETKILHQRYPDIGKYQMSCFAAKESAKGKRWCEACDKCAYMFTLFKAFEIDTKNLGFQENMFDEKHAYLFETFFSRSDDSHFYGSQGELALGFYYSMRNGCEGVSIDRFKKELLPQIDIEALHKIYLGIHPTTSMPASLKEKVTIIFNESLTS